MVMKGVFCEFRALGVAGVVNHAMASGTQVLRRSLSHRGDQKIQRARLHCKIF